MTCEPPSPQQPRSEGEPPSRPRPKAKWWQKLLLVGFAFVILGMVELGLHLFGYGPDLRFVVTRLDQGNRRIMGINSQAYKRFHFRLATDPAKTRFAPWREFVEPKPAGTFRVFFMGESSVEGYPHAPNGAAPAFLQHLLQSAWPDRRVEVVNCGVTAINSFSLREWAPELLRHEPDLLVIYAGHNEFYGAYGAGTSHAIGDGRTAVILQIKLLDLKLARLVNDVITLAGRSAQAPAEPLMARLAQQQAIALDSPTYTTCRESFRGNLNDILDAAGSAGVPVVLCNLVSNERDLVPMTSMHKPDLTEPQQQEWQQHFDAGMRELNRGTYTDALREFTSAAGIDDSDAGLIYRSAQCHEHVGAIDQAREQYRRARDLDGLRFRATAEFNRVIQDLASEHAAVFVDILAAFQAASPNGLIGWDLMTDHLHPTVSGHYLLAKAICAALAEQRRDWPSIDMSLLPAYQQAAAHLGNDQMSEMVAKMTVYRLTAGFPYAGTPNAALHRRLEQEIADWQTSLKGPTAAGLEAWSAAGTWDPLHYHVARAWLEAGDEAQALVFFRRADAQTEPHSLSSALARCGIARCGIARCLSTLSSDEAGRAEARGYAHQLRDYLNECALIQPDHAAEFSQLASELDGAE